VTGLLPGTGLRLSPAATHPPFGWEVALPSDWALLDTHPASWQRSLERLVDERLAGRRLRPAERRQVRDHLADLVANAQRAASVLTLVQLGRLSTGGVASAGLSIAWHDSSPATADLATVRQAVGRTGVVDEIATPAGDALLQRDHLSVVPPGGTSRVGLTSLQVFLPLTGTCWTVVVATAGARPELVPMLRSLVVEVVGSIRRADEPPPRSTPTDPAPTDLAPTDPARVDRGPGIERGFGTLVVHRAEPGTPGRHRAEPHD
jgi:hypothetical protein